MWIRQRNLHEWFDENGWFDNNVVDVSVFNILENVDKWINKQKKDEYKKLFSRFYYFVSNSDIVNFPGWPLNREKTINTLVNNFDEFIKEREFMDSLVELHEKQYQKLREYVKIPKKIEKLREYYTIFQQHKEAISKYRENKLCWKDNEKFRKYLNEKLNNPMFNYIITYMTDNWLFSNLENDFNLPADIKSSRNSYNRYIIKRDNSDSSEIKDSLCDLIFGDNIKNVQLNIETILDRAQFLQNYLENDDKNVLYLIVEFLNLKESENWFSKECLQQKIKDIFEEDKKLKEKWLDLKQWLHSLFIKAQFDFQNDLKNWLTKINFEKMPHKQLKTTSWHDINFYEVDNNNNKDVFLVRSIQFKNKHWKPKDWRLNREWFSNFLTNGKSWCAYSLIPSKSLFGMHDDQILFWFSGFGNNEVMTANTFDANTTSTPGILRHKQQFFPLSNFLEKTSTYNEIFISNEEIMYPDYIISQENPPKQEFIDLAYEFWIPIVLFKNKKEDRDSEWINRNSAWSYDYYSFNNSMIQNIFCPKCKPVESISQFLEQFY